MKEEDIETVMEPQKRVVDMTPEELRAHIMRPLSPKEEARRQRAFDEMKELQIPIDINTATLKRVARRAEEVLYGNKTWEQLIDEES